MNNFTYCSTLLKDNLEEAINFNTKVFDKSKLNLDFSSQEKYLYYSTCPDELLNYAQNSIPILDYNKNGNWGLEVENENKLFLRKDYILSHKTPYCPIILGRWDFIRDNNYYDLRIICFKQENFQLKNINYQLYETCISPSIIRIEKVLGIKDLKFVNEYGKKRIIYEDVSNNYIS